MSDTRETLLHGEELRANADEAINLHFRDAEAAWMTMIRRHGEEQTLVVGGLEERGPCLLDSELSEVGRLLRLLLLDVKRERDNANQRQAPQRCGARRSDKRCIHDVIEVQDVPA